jgi:hypothetical protein
MGTHMGAMTLEEIKAAWEKYKNHKVMRVLKNGKWEIALPTNHGLIDGTKAQRVYIKEIMEFPEYLEKRYHGSC